MSPSVSRGEVSQVPQSPSAQKPKSQSAQEPKCPSAQEPKSPRAQVPTAQVPKFTKNLDFTHYIIALFLQLPLISFTSFGMSSPPDLEAISNVSLGGISSWAGIRRSLMVFKPSKRKIESSDKDNHLHKLSVSFVSQAIFASTTTGLG
jgi:hypothetical protein